MMPHAFGCAAAALAEAVALTVPLGLPPDVLEMMQNMGISVEDVMTQIAAMVREGAAANG